MKPFLSGPRDGIDEVRLACCCNVRRATNSQVAIHHADGETILYITRQDVPEHGKRFRTLGRFRVAAGKLVVLADAVHRLPLADSLAQKRR